MTKINTAIWQPHSDRDVTSLRHVSGLYGAGVIEVWDESQLSALVARHGALVALEKGAGGVKLETFNHPVSGLYLIGPHNGSIPAHVLALGQVVEVETPSRYPLQPHVAAGIVLHHRHVQLEGVPA